MVAVATLVLGGSAATAIPLARVPTEADPLVFTGTGVPSVPDTAATPPTVEFLRRGLLAGLEPVIPAVTPAAASPNDAFAALPADGFAAYATGTAHHTDQELSGEDVGAEIDMAASDAAYASRALLALSDELGRPIVGPLAAGNGFGRGRALQVTPPEALGTDADLEDLDDPAEAKAPPSKAPVSKETQFDLSPVLRADTFQAEASARAVATGCVIGNDLARGSASANDTDLVDSDPDDNSTQPLLSVGADEPPRAVTQSISRATLVPLGDRPGRFGVMAETRQTIAPITFGLPGIEEKFTVEVGGEWALRARADGKTGTISFGPEPGSGDQPMLRLIQGKEVIDEVGLREIGGRTGIYIDGKPVGEIRVGGEARAIGGNVKSTPTETPTLAAAAVDIVVMRLFDPRAEMRVGHMEVAVRLPADGVECPGIALKKQSQPASVRPGDKLSWTVSISNPNDCALDKVKVQDATTVTAGVSWRAVTTTPKASRATDGSLLFEGIGPIRTGETKTVRIDGEIDAGSAPGSIVNRATAVGTCGPAPVSGAAEASIPVEVASPPGLVQGPSAPADEGGSGRSAAGAQGENLIRPAPAPSGGESAGGSDEAAGNLPRTGGPAGLLLGVSLLATGRLLRRLRRRKGSS